MDVRACFLGDSYTSGQGDETGLGWPGRVFLDARAAGVDLTIYNLGVRGDTAAQVARRAPAEAKARFRTGDKKAVVFAFGANDLGQGLPLSETIAELDRLLHWAQEAGYDTFVLSPPVMFGPRAEWPT